MKIILDDKRYIREDYRTSVALCETKIAIASDSSAKHTEGTEYEREEVIGYFPNVANATKRYIDTIAIEQTSNQATLKEYLDIHKKLVKGFYSLLQGES